MASNVRTGEETRSAEAAVADFSDDEVYQNVNKSDSELNRMGSKVFNYTVVAYSVF